MREYYVFFFQAEDGIRYLVRSRGLGDVYKRQVLHLAIGIPAILLSIPVAYLWSGFFGMPGLMAYILSLIHI